MDGKVDDVRGTTNSDLVRDFCNKLSEDNYSPTAVIKRGKNVLVTAWSNLT